MDTPNTTTDAAQETPAKPQLSPKINDAVDAWWGTTVENVGPLISTTAYAVLSAARDNLKAVLTTAEN